MVQTKYRRIVMEKQWMELYTAELDVLDFALWQYSLKRSTTKKQREICEKIRLAIAEKDEAYLVY